MKRTDMVREGAQQLVVAENAIETAISDTADLMSRLSRMRVDSKLSAVIGQDVIDGLVNALKGLSEARSSMVTVHAGLDLVKTQIGCGAMLLGTGDDKPGTRPTGRLIQVVEDGAAAA